MAASFRHVREIHKLLRTSQTTVDRIFLNTCGRQYRFHHILSKHVRNKIAPVSLKPKRPQICAVLIQRYNSSDVASKTDYIPEPPLPPPESFDITETLNALGEPTFASLGLGSYWPPGLVQNALEFLHVSCDMPWWAAIMTGTIILRICMFPLVIKSRQNVINMANHMPTVQLLQEKMTDAKNRGDMLGSTRAAIELREYMIRNNVNPLKNFLVPIAQVPVFFSVFFGLRKMAYLPVESLTTGGLFWFLDLTVPDPYYALPVMTMLTLLATLELGADGLSTQQMTVYMKYIMRGMPVVMMFVVCNFPAAMLCYWTTSNAFSLLQVMFLKIPAVSVFFKIPEMVPHPAHMVKKKQGFRESFRESWKNAAMANEVENRRRADALKFRKAGEGALPKTYAFDPTKVQTNKKAISAKSKS